MNNKANTLNYPFKNKYYFKRIIIIVLFFLIVFNLVQPLTLFASNSNYFAKENHSIASMDEDGNIYMRENLDNRIHPASLTKIAISILAIEKLNLDDKIFIEEIDYILPFDYVTTPLYVGETLTAEDLIHATMLKSGNDAAIYLAKHIFGNKEAFIKGINKYLKDIGLIDTNFKNSFGLSERNHYTTPYDLLTLSKYAMQNETFRQIVSKNKYIIPANNFSEERVIRTTSLFTNENSPVFNVTFNGIKSGYTEKAKDCFITANKIFDKEFYFIYTGASSRIDKFIKIQEMYDETKYILEEKSKIQEYIKTNIDSQNVKYLHYLHSKYFFTALDKVVFISFSLITFLIILKLIFIKNRNK